MLYFQLYSATVILILRFQSLYQEVSTQEALIGNVITTLKEDLKAKEPGPEKDSLSATVTDIEKRWNELHKNVVKRHSIIKKIYPFAEQFNSETEKLLPWLVYADKEVRSIQPLSSQATVLVQQKRSIEVSYDSFHCIYANLSASLMIIQIRVFLVSIWIRIWCSSTLIGTFATVLSQLLVFL